MSEPGWVENDSIEPGQVWRRKHPLLLEVVVERVDGGFADGCEVLLLRRGTGVRFSLSGKTLLEKYERVVGGNDER